VAFSPAWGTLNGGNKRLLIVSSGIGRHHRRGSENHLATDASPGPIFRICNRNYFLSGQCQYKNKPNPFYPFHI